jgi:hypothetical protein
VRAVRRLCCRLPLFEEAGSTLLMICAKGAPMSSLVLRQRSNLSMNILCTISVTLRLPRAISGLDSEATHAGGRLLRCRSSVSCRAKKSPQ